MQIIYIKSKDKQITENSQIQQTVSESAMAKSLLKASFWPQYPRRKLVVLKTKFTKIFWLQLEQKQHAFLRN